jgi:Fe-S-cluster containining protein
VSSYYIPLRPRDAAARVRIPESLIVRAAGQAPGSAMMKYKEDGLCPMLDGGKCSIYEVRPQTCRDYDCRIFAAAGLDAGGPDKHVINRRVRAWRFTYPTEADAVAHRAVLAASTFIQSKRDCFPGGRAPTAATGIAVLAIKSYGVFLDGAVLPGTDEATAAAIVEASRKFDAGA